ncbi:hypothetical protein SK128_012183 [Halocaridina rubra]|uniref:VAN3-binding protein-like auxin canalisation domain-containing protein n=1 Tax=Halocaridina rubra TaxID=373956 RepID=A0AAN8WBN8_HALRR
MQLFVSALTGFIIFLRRVTRYPVTSSEVVATAVAASASAVATIAEKCEQGLENREFDKMKNACN